MYTLIQQPHLIGMSIITEKQKENELQFLHVAQLIKYQWKEPKGDNAHESASSLQTE